MNLRDTVLLFGLEFTIALLYRVRWPAFRPLALVCHVPGMPRHVKTIAGKPLVARKSVTGFTNGERANVGLTTVVPFLVEDGLLALDAIYSKVKNWGVYTAKGGLLITGQNPASSRPVADLLIETLEAL